MKAKVWRSNDPQQVTVWMGDLEQTETGYQFPDEMRQYLDSDETYDAIVFDSELPPYARDIADDESLMSLFNVDWAIDQEDGDDYKIFSIERWKLNIILAVLGLLAGLGLGVVTDIIAKLVF